MSSLRTRGSWLAVCLWAATASAQSVPPQPIFETGVNYGYNSVSTSGSGTSNQSGASIYGQYFFNGTNSRWGGRGVFSVIGEFAGSGSGSGRLDTYLFGPRWGIEWRHVFWYGGVALGGAHVRVNGIDPTGAPVSFARGTFAVNFATAGVDLLFGKHYVIKLLEADDLAFEVPDPATGQSHWREGLRASAGIAFRFGRR